MRQTEVNLSKRKRRIVNEFRTKGLRRAREVDHAHILTALDRGVPGQQIMAVLKIGRTALWRTHEAYAQGGVEFALHDEARPGKPKHHTGAAAAQVTALACSAPSAGHSAGSRCC